MKVAAVTVLILALAACSKKEPPPATVAAAAKPAPAAVTPGAAIPTPPPAPAASVPVAPAKDGLSADLSAKVPAEAEALAKAGLPAVALAKEGAALFTATCATCHMADGSGVPYLQPSIKGSALISNADPQYLLTLILRGSPSLGEGAKAFENDMPPLDHLSDAEIAALATYVRQRFAAVPMTKPVTPAEVAVARARPGMP